MTIQSKMWILNTCQEIQHPWTDKCTNAVAGLLLSSTPYCLKVYTMVYMVSKANDLFLFYKVILLYF